MTACLKEVIILQLWSGLVTAFDFSRGPPDQYLYVTLHVCLALATNRRKTLFGSTKCVEKLCLTTCAIQYAGLWVRQSRCCGEWGTDLSCLLEFGVWRWRYTLTATNHHPAQLCSPFCASPGQSKRGGWRQSAAREPSCSGAFQVRETTRGGRKELGDRDEPEVEDGE